MFRQTFSAKGLAVDTACMLIKILYHLYFSNVHPKGLSFTVLSIKKYVCMHIFILRVLCCAICCCLYLVIAYVYMVYMYLHTGVCMFVYPHIVVHNHVLVDEAQKTVSVHLFFTDVNFVLFSILCICQSVIHRYFIMMTGAPKLNCFFYCITHGAD